VLVPIKDFCLFDLFFFLFRRSSSHNSSRRILFTAVPRFVVIVAPQSDIKEPRFHLLIESVHYIDDVRFMATVVGVTPMLVLMVSMMAEGGGGSKRKGGGRRRGGGGGGRRGDR
jgi:hypothetical protein